MQFKTIDALLEYVAELDGDISAMNFDIQLASPVEEATDPLEVETLDISLTITSFYENDEFPADFIINEGVDVENDNIWYVDQAEAIKGSCGTGKIHFDDRVITLGVCEMDNKIKANLNIQINGTDFTNVPFTLKPKSDGMENRFVIHASSLS